MQYPINGTVYSTSQYIQMCANSFFTNMIKYARCVEGNLPLISIILVLYVILCVTLYYLLFDARYFTNRGDIKSKGKILFVISHPDDECMFFGPAIINLAKEKNKQVFLLCLSYGNYNQQGKHRKNELWKSCTILGIPESNIFLQKITLLPDDPNVMWNERVIFNLVVNYVETFRFDAVVTFDRDGISGHLNHKSVYFALAHTVANRIFPKYCSVYCLDSVNKIRKYSFIFDLLLSICFSSNLFILPVSQCFLVKNALKAHQSQHVWFRKIYIWISRYAYINTFSLLYENEAAFDINYRGTLD